jgi:hypothetical protein
MSDPRREALGIVLRALAWLPLCFALWYAAAGFVAWLPAKLASPVIGAAAGKVQQTQVAQRVVLYSVHVEGPYRPGRSTTAEANLEVAAATYTFGIAVFAALAAAVRGWRQPARFALGLALLLPLPAFGIAFDALRQLGSTPQLVALLAWGPAARNAIALGYQAGSLLLPTLGPIVAWLVLYPGAWRRAKPAA